MQTVELDQVEERMRIALDLLMRILDVTDKGLATKTGLSRQAVQARRTGAARIRPAQAEAFAAALNVPVSVLSMIPKDLFSWLAERPYAASDSNREPTDIGAKAVA